VKKIFGGKPRRNLRRAADHRLRTTGVQQCQNKAINDFFTSIKVKVHLSLTIKIIYLKELCVDLNTKKMSFK
jgi:hypothetical protein